MRGVRGVRRRSGDLLWRIPQVAEVRVPDGHPTELEYLFAGALVNPDNLRIAVERGVVERDDVREDRGGLAEGRRRLDLLVEPATLEFAVAASKRVDKGLRFGVVGMGTRAVKVIRAPSRFTKPSPVTFEIGINPCANPPRFKPRKMFVVNV